MSNSLSQLHLINTQIHQELVVNFTSGINVIIGPTNKGKSTIIRAIRWISHNRPTGDGLCKFDTDSTSAIVQLSDGHTISRVKGIIKVPGKIEGKFKNKKVNQYVIDEAGPADEPFTLAALKAGEVPAEVQQLIKLTDVNIQPQLDAPFMISWSSKQIRTFINRMVDLTSIDNVLGYLEKDQRKLESISGHLTTTESEQQQNLTVYANLDSAIADLGIIEIQIETATELETEIKLLNRISDKAVILQQRNVQLSPVASLSGKIGTLIERRAVAVGMWKRIQTLKALYLQYTKLQEIEGRKEKCISLNERPLKLLSKQMSAYMLKEDIKTGLEQIDNRQRTLKQREVKLKTVSELKTIDWQQAVAALQVKTIKRNKISKLHTHWLDLKARHIEAYDTQEAAQETFDELMPDECPLCGGIQS